MSISTHITNIRNKIPQNVKVIAFFINDLRFYEHLYKLAWFIHNRGYYTILLFPTEMREDNFSFTEKLPVFHIEANCLQNMDFIDLFFAMDSVPQHFPQLAKAIAIPHYLGFVSINNTSNKPYLFWCHNSSVNFDYVILPQANLAHFNASDFVYCCSDLYPKSMLRRPVNYFTIIPGGYLKLDCLIEKQSLITQDRVSILYAPTPLYKSRLAADGKSIIMAILDNYPDRELIFRPYPSDNGKAEILSLVSEFSKKRNFYWDKKPSNMDSFARSILLITDSSNTANTFSMSTLCPHIRCSFESNSHDLEGVGNEHEFGFETFNRYQLVNAINHCLDHAQYHKNNIRENRDKFVLNISKSFNYIADSIDYILNDKARNNWIQIPRKPLSIDIHSDEEYADLVEQTYQSKQSVAEKILYYALKLFPMSRRLQSLYKKVICSQVHFRYEAVELTYTNELKITQKQQLSAFPQEKLLSLFSKSNTNISFMIWGVSGNYKINYQRNIVNLDNNCFIGFIDKNPNCWGNLVDGYEVYPPEKLILLHPCVVIICTAYAANVIDQINEMLRF